MRLYSETASVNAVMSAWRSSHAFDAGVILAEMAAIHGPTRPILSEGQPDRTGGTSRRWRPLFHSGPVEPVHRPRPRTIGHAGQNFFQGPFNWNMDTSLVKRIRVRERQSVMVRLEAYNLFNTTIFAAPATNIFTPQTFGRISGTINSPRNLQAALRYDF
jgi:hypothetical protein